MHTFHLLAVAALVGLSAAALPAARLPTRHYTTRDGLARDSVHCILKDRDGFLWFATGEGISRFDGYEFTNYRRADGLPDRDVRSIVQGRDGSFLVATGYGAARLNPAAADPKRRFSVYELPAGGTFHSVEAVAERGSTSWIGTDGGLFAADSARPLQVRPILLNPGAPEPRITSMLEDAGHVLWIGTSAGLFRADLSGRVQDVPLIGKLPFVTALRAEAGTLWIGTQAGRLIQAAIGDGGTVKQTAYAASLQRQAGNASVESILRARDGSLWIATSAGVARRKPDAARFEWLGESEGFLNGDAQSLTEDGDGDVWVGYDGAGVIRVSSTGFVTFDEHDGLPAAQITSITAGRNGRPIVTTLARPGLAAYRWETDRFARHQLGKDATRFPTLWRPWHQVLAEDAHGEWWTGSAHGLLRFLAPERPGAARLQAVPAAAENVAHVFEDSKGNIWFSSPALVAYPPPGHKTALCEWERAGGRVHCYSEADGLPPLDAFAVLYIAEDYVGQIWVGLYRTGVARLRQGRFEVFTAADGIPAGGIRYIYEDAKHRLWLASGRGGVGCIRDPALAKIAVSQYSTTGGLGSDEIQAIAEDNFGRIYLGTGLGVDRLDPETRRIVHYTEADGLAPGEVQDVVRDQAGDLWFGTYKAVSRLHPLPDPPIRPLPVRFAAVRINGQVQGVALSAAQIRIADVPPGSNSVQVDYFALALAGTGNIRYQYRMSGIDRAWSEPIASRSMLYSNLRAGSYAFQARCLNPIPGDPATLRFMVLPYLWERWWFTPLCVLALLGVLYGAYSYRLTNILKIQHMRTRLARDLHDDIGSGLSKIAILSEVGQRKIAGGPTAGQTLDRIAETSREVLDAVGDLVWATNAAAAPLEDLIPRMRSFASQLFEAQGVEFELRVTGSPLDKALSPETLRQLYLIFKEAVNNAAKHSKCTRAWAELKSDRGAFIMSVADNGVGFLPRAEPGHHGLASLEARAKALGGKITWVSEKGATVILWLPLLK